MSFLPFPSAIRLQFNCIQTPSSDDDRILESDTSETVFPRLPFPFLPTMLVHLPFVPALSPLAPLWSSSLPFPVYPSAPCTASSGARGKVVSCRDGNWKGNEGSFCG